MYGCVTRIVCVVYGCVYLSEHCKIGHVRLHSYYGPQGPATHYPTLHSIPFQLTMILTESRDLQNYDVIHTEVCVIVALHVGNVFYNRATYICTNMILLVKDRKILPTTISEYDNDYRLLLSKMIILCYHE